MPEEFDSENLENKPAPYANQGGPAIKPSGANSGKGVTGNAAVDKVIGAGKDKALDAATGGAWEAAKRMPVIGKMLDELSNKALKYFTKNFWKTALLANWPTLTTIGIIVLLLFVTTVPAFARIGSSRRGVDGKSQPVDASVLSAADMASVQEVLGNSNTVPGDPTKWYFNQADPAWANIHLAGWKTENKFKNVGCAVTSAAMIAAFYSGGETRPDTFGEFMVSQTGSAQMDPSQMASYLASKGINRTLASVPINLSSVKSEIAAGNPILAQGVQAFGSTGFMHYAVIIGVSKDDKFLVINDPSPVAERGKPARYSTADDLTNGKIKGMWALHAK